MDITIPGKAGKIRVTDDTATGVVEITVEDPDGVSSFMQIGNGEVFELALKLLNVVGHTR